MKPKLNLLFALTIACLMAMGQRSAIELTFTAVNNTTHVQLDSIKIMNFTQGGDTTLYWPDTILDYQVGIADLYNERTGFQVFQNYPNPVTDQTTISLYVPDKDRVSLIVTDILGRMILQSERVLDKGTHTFRFTSGSANLYFFTARCKGNSSSIKILQTGVYSGGTTTLEYTGSEDSSPQLKAMKEVQGFSFTLGDTLLFIGYVNTLESGILGHPEDSETITFQFATDIPCPGTSTVEYEEQVYNTIQIFSQCWLKENLNVGTRINSTSGGYQQTDNGTIEKYCFNNDEANCAIYGGLYEWPEAMQYVTTEGAQGICPTGWHIASDNEWKILEGTVDSQYEVGDPEWDSTGWRGLDVGGNLKEAGTAHWGSPNTGATNPSGFTGLPGGYRGRINGSFFYLGYDGGFWSSSQHDSDSAWTRGLYYGNAYVYRFISYKGYGFSVRCLQD